MVIVSVMFPFAKKENCYDLRIISRIERNGI